ncbi:VPA1269 family protein [Pseudomonas monteilii]|uniref:VPA1269 family protein n=1 Tax=Pseudomonas monteilii TaxID=76759 RepID=UPI0023649DAD|nr:VPA1269 family protein [Pseudomonas monteilii]MDD2127267.1 VPA1269 family protein [Pseudomonas monteilii]
MKKSFHSFANAQHSVRELGITSCKEYQSKRHLDAKLPSRPERAYASTGWIDWYDFLGIVKSTYYATYNEAQLAALRLGVTSQADYKLQCITDERLPSKPQRIYLGKGWVSWGQYLGTSKKARFYALYSKAEAAAQALGAGNRKDYHRLYRTDSNLPANPHIYYKGKGWTDWESFLGTSSSYYRSYEEAVDAVRMLKITSVPQYKSRRHEDPRLPPHPEILYAGAWEDFYIFFGKSKRASFYPTYLEAQAAAQSLKVRNRESYYSEYWRDRHLPGNPDKVYKICGWKGWKSFLGIDNFYSYEDAKKAVKRMGIRTVDEYRDRRKEDVRLYSNPHTMYADWRGWHDFLGTTKRRYHTFEKAQIAVRKLGITKESEYKLKYSKDPKLPRTPKAFYKKRGWQGFRHFIGRPFYRTLAEARIAVQALKISNCPEYKVRYREDPRLPSDPKLVYSSEWVSWHDLLSIKKRISYDTYSQARDATQRLGIKSISEYRERYFEDENLPAAPMAFYKDSVDWYDFLGNEKPNYYAHLLEAKLAAQALNIQTQSQYANRYKEDARLPASPDNVYSRDGWVDWYDFLGKERPVNYADWFPRVWEDVQRWLENQTNLGQKKASIRKFISDYYQPLGLPDDPLYLLMRSNPFNAEGYRQFIESIHEAGRRASHGHILSFYNWVLNEYCTDTDGYESVVVPDCRNPFETIMAGFADSLQTIRPTQSTKTPLGYEYILRAREYLVPDSDLALVNRPKLNQLPRLQELFNTRTDWLDVEESMIDRDDPNCVWRYEKVKRVIDGHQRWIGVYQVWSPARFIALYTLLRFPLRGLQITLLDSGEADAELPYIDEGSGEVKWSKNTSSLVSMSRKKMRLQGVVQRGHQGLPKTYVTTNKTGVGEGGYEIEWIPDDLVYWFLTLRDWQSKFNPLSEPTSWTSIQAVLGKDRLNKKILQARGNQCFLFRTDSSGKPLHTFTAFREMLPALLHRIQREEENLVTVMETGKYLSPYTPHSLRVSLITAFIADGNAPIHLISKLVGHSSLVMTIYYVKMNALQMRRTMGETEKRAAQFVAEKNADLIRMEGLHPLRDQLIVTDGNRKLIESDVPNSSCVIFDWGVCPMSASSCHIGGLDSITGKADLAVPVPAGYLGQKNCPRCRFFVTGVPFLGGLVALANEVSLEIYTESGRFEGFSNLVRELEFEYYDVVAKGGVDTKQWERKRATANEQQSGGKLDGLLNDYVRLNHFIQSCLALINGKDSEEPASESIRLIVAGDVEEVGLSVCESSGQYHLLSEICQNATIYQSTNPSRAIPLISQAIDRMAENNNLKPAMFRLTDDQKLSVIKELNKLLLSRLGSWERIDDLFSGDLMLLDVDSHRPDISRVSSDVQNILMNASAILPASKKVNHA